MSARLRVLLAGLLTVLVVFTGRLVYLQFVMAAEYRLLSEENSFEQRHVQPLRGRILARDGTVLADNRIAVDLMYWGGEVMRWERLRYLLNLSESPEAPDPGDPSERVYGSVLAWNIPDSLVPSVAELVAGQPNLYLRERVERTYPTGLAAQVLGYTQEADPERFPNYALGDLVGQMGLEASLQETLFGVSGAELVQVNNRRTVLDRQTIAQAYPGQDVILTLDPELQRAAERVLKDVVQYVNADRKRQGLPADETVARGALIAMNPQTGEILAMASQPTFDQNVFTHRPSSLETIAALLTDAHNRPLANRAVEAYPPASTFKLVTSSALLEGRFITPETRYPCTAGFNFLGVYMRNWANTFRGNLDVTGAIADSCNTFYFRAAAATPEVRRGWSPFAKALTDRAREFGYGQIVGVGLPEEKPGRVPTDEWSREFKGYGWRPGDSANASIGQGDVLATPLQVAQLLSTIALDGQQVQPHLVKRIGETPVTVSERLVPGRFWDTLKAGLRRMVTHHGGRSFVGPYSDFFRQSGVETAGKTGTAQNAQGAGYEHTWYMGYGPLDAPELVVVAFIENGGSSTYVAIPVARDFMAAYWGVSP